uniref:Uncharacterized protein n=1 Tax=Nelumbo nucifera TaxID=4432 RepID=A0A822YWM9_NELNU|nr:TPA_asm: hypothetical protein HUJ06_007588 [Nelumbo nucifera]
MEEREFTEEGLCHPQDFGSALLIVCHSCFSDRFFRWLLCLYTNLWWIVDEDGQRVKLACVNWAAHLEAMVAEGRKQPLDVISKRIVSMGFNCVRPPTAL